MKKVNLKKKLSTFSDHWNPKIVGELNGQHVKIAKLKGEFVMHKHDKEDELFMVIKGVLFVEMDDEIVEVNEGEFIIIPKGTNHKPFAPEEVEVMLFEPLSTLNTGNTRNDFTLDELDRLDD